MTVFSLVMITVIQEQGNDAKADSETVHFMYLIKMYVPFVFLVLGSKQRTQCCCLL